MARILIVDDDPDVFEASRLILEAEGHEVRGASSREEGMKAIRAGEPDLLLLDVMMAQPDDGITMAQELRRDGFAAPILMLTGIGKVTGLRYGKDEEMLPVDDFQEKPMDPEDLIRKVAELLKGKEQ